MTVAWLLEFTRQRDLWLLPTWRVVQDVVVPETKERGCRYTELPAVAASGAVGPAQLFVSHAWGAAWGSLVAAVAEGASPDRRVWVDIFAVAQHTGDRKTADLLALEAVVQASAALLLVVSTDAPLPDLLAAQPSIESLLGSDAGRALPQLRIWCVFEIFTAVEQERPIVMKLGKLVPPPMNAAAAGEPPAPCEHFSFVGETSTPVVNQLIWLTDVSKAQATVAADRELILGQVARGRGAAAVNASVRGAILGAFSCAHFPEVAAAACGEADALAPLLAGGATALEEARGWVQQTALHAAAGGGYTECVTRLLDAGADAAARNVSGRTPLMRAAMGGHVGALHALLRHQRCRDALDVEARDDVGDTALRLAAQDGHLGTVAALLRAGCAPDVRNDDGATPAMAAAFCGHADVLRMLFDAGAQPGAGDNDGSTALMRAAASGQADCVAQLLAAGASANAVDGSGWTAALCAAEEGRTQSLRALRSAGADFAARDAQGRSLMQLADAGGHTEVQAFLRDCAAGTVL